MSWLRENEEIPRLSKEHVFYAVEQSLERLQTITLILPSALADRPFGAFQEDLNANIWIHRLNSIRGNS